MVSLPRASVVAETGLAFAVAAGWFAVCTLLVGALTLSSRVPLAVLIIVLDLVVVWAGRRYLGIGPAVAVGVAGVVALDWYCIPPIHDAALPDAENAAALGTYLIAGALLGQLASSARRRAEASEREVRVLADEQAALRRVATLVAVETPPERVFASVTEEVGRLLHIDIATLLRYEIEGTATVVAAWSRSDRHLPVGTRWEMDDGGTVVSRVRETGLPQRVDDYSGSPGAFGDALRELEVRSSAGSPVVVDGRVWGVMVGASLSADPIPEGTELRLGEFTQLTAAAVANAESKSELTASRARIVAAGDEARQRIERDLHDGVQQRLVSLALEVRRAESLAESEQDSLRSVLSGLRAGLVEVVDELREVSHGIHPAILTEGGLRPALASLARRSALPVELDVSGTDRLPDPVEVCLYYVTSEALTNAIKHAQATFVSVDLEAGPEVVRLQVRDDGVGGAGRRGGSGLVGLTDRVHALGGSLEVLSPADGGTSLDVRIPIASIADPTS